MNNEIEKQHYLEREFLSILILDADLVYGLLQIKPEFLEIPKNIELAKATIKCIKENGIVDVPEILKNCTFVTSEYFAETIDEELVEIDRYHIKKQFMLCQYNILNNYKKRVIKEYGTKLQTGEISLDNYLKLMSKIEEYKIKMGGTMVDEKELKDRIKSAEKINLKKFTKLNDSLALSKGDFLIIGASTGTGKSSLLLNMMNDLMEDYQCIYFNMEMSTSTIYKRMISINSNVPLEYVEKQVSDYQANLINQAMQRIAKNKVIVEHKATDLDEITKIIKLYKSEGKHTIVFLDHIGLIRVSGMKSQYEIMTEIAKRLRQICLENDCTIISASQLNRSSYNSEELSISMLKDSGELENSASKVILLYRDKEDKARNEKTLTPIMQLEIVKNRDGRLATIKTKYDKTKQIFEEVSDYGKTAN